MKILSSAVLVLGIAAWGPSATAAEESRTVTGVITSVKASERTIRVLGDESRQRHTYRIPEGAPITMDGKPARLRRVLVGHRVTLRFVQPAGGPREVVALRVPDPEQIVDVPPAAAARTELPSTASLMPALGLGGAALLAAGVFLRSRRMQRQGPSAGR